MQGLCSRDPRDEEPQLDAAIWKEIGTPWSIYTPHLAGGFIIHPCWGQKDKSLSPIAEVSGHVVNRIELHAQRRKTKTSLVRNRMHIHFPRNAEDATTINNRI